MTYSLLGSREKGEKEIGKKENGEIFNFFSAWIGEENTRERKNWWWDPQNFFLPSTGKKTELMGWFYIKWPLYPRHLFVIMGYSEENSSLLSAPDSLVLSQVARKSLNNKSYQSRLAFIHSEHKFFKSFFSAQGECGFTI